MSFVMVDVESDGSITGDYSMISFGPVLVTPALDKTHDCGQFGGVVSAPLALAR